MNQTRAMLDALMGPGRDVKGATKNKEQFKESTVCKAFLLGFCARDKNALGGRRTIDVCRKLHSDVLKSQFEESPHAEKYRREYQLLSLWDFESLIRECDSFITTERQRIHDDSRKQKIELDKESQAKLIDLSDKASALQARVDTLDDTDSKRREDLTKQLTEAKKAFDSLKIEAMKKARDEQIVAQVCNTCGFAYTGDEEREKHLQYRIHKMFVKVRDGFAELEPKKVELELEKAQQERRQKRSDDRENAEAKEAGRKVIDDKERCEANRRTRSSQRRNSRCSRARDLVVSSERGNREEKARRSRSIQRRSNRCDRDQVRSGERRRDRTKERCQDRRRERRGSRNRQRVQPRSRSPTRGSPIPLRQRRSPSINRSKSKPDDRTADRSRSRLEEPSTISRGCLESKASVVSPDEEEDMPESEADEDDRVPLLREAIKVVPLGGASDFLRAGNGFFAECLRDIAHSSTALPKTSLTRFLEFLDSGGKLEARVDAREIVSIMRSLVDELNTEGNDAQL